MRHHRQHLALPKLLSSQLSFLPLCLLGWLQAFEADMGRRGNQDLRWLQQARRSGTTQDKVAAMSVLVQVRWQQPHSFVTSCNCFAVCKVAGCAVAARGWWVLVQVGRQQPFHSLLWLNLAARGRHGWRT